MNYRTREFNLFERPITHSLLVLVVPFLEYLFARYATKHLFHLSVGWGSYLTDYSLLIPLPVAFVLLMDFFQLSRVLTLRLQRGAFLLHVFFLSAFFIFEAVLARFGWGAVPLSGPIWWGLVLTGLGSGFFIFVPPSYYFKNANRAVAVPCFLISFSVVIYQNSAGVVWKLLQRPLAFFLCPTMGLLSRQPLTCSLVDLDRYIYIAHPKLKILVGEGCGGGDSFFLFLFCSVIFFTLYRKNFSSRFWAGFLFFGMCFMFFWNLFRITFLFFTGLALRDLLAPRVGYWVFTKLFHVHAGWILYVLAIGWYWSAASRFYRAEKATSLAELQPT